MKQPIKQITLPSSGAIVILLTWITGRQKEYIEQPLFKASSMGGEMKKSGDMEVSINQEEAVHESAHRDIECYVKSFQSKDEGSKELIDSAVILKTILDEIPSTDYDFILKEIKTIQGEAKKK